MNNSVNNISSPRSSTFQMRINPDVKQQAESLFMSYGLTLTDAVNIFLQQSIRTEGIPFLLSPENEDYLKAKAAKRLLAEVQKGWDSANERGWLSYAEVKEQLGISNE